MTLTESGLMFLTPYYGGENYAGTLLRFHEADLKRESRSFTIYGPAQLLAQRAMGGPVLTPVPVPVPSALVLLLGALPPCQGCC